VIDHFRKTRASKRDADLVSLEHADRTESTQAQSVLADVERAQLIEDINACLCDLPPETRERDITIFWLYYRQGFTAGEIAALPLGLSLKGVESTLHRVTRLVRTCLVELRRRQSGGAKKGSGAGTR